MTVAKIEGIINNRNINRYVTPFPFASIRAKGTTYISFFTLGNIELEHTYFGISTRFFDSGKPSTLACEPAAGTEYLYVSN
ncbi:MAG: hypothetical protein NVS2B12_10510 [Ktedonobacteraceae bacterium]